MPQNPEDAVDELVVVLRNHGGSAVPRAARQRLLARLEALDDEPFERVSATPRSKQSERTSGRVARRRAAAGAALATSLVKVAAAHPATTMLMACALSLGIGVGAHSAFAPVSPVPAKASPSAAPVLPRRAPNDGRMPTKGGAPPEIASSSSASSGASAERRKQPASLPVERELSPAPEIPAAPEEVRLREQQALLDRARAELLRGQAADALRSIGSHRALFPATVLAEERDAIEILALSMSGRRDEARARGERFAARYPQSLFLATIRESGAERDGGSASFPIEE